MRSSLLQIFPAKHYIPGVEPRGFEPLTSAVQRRNQYVVQPCRAVSARTVQPYKCAKSLITIVLL